MYYNIYVKKSFGSWLLEKRGEEEIHSLSKPSFQLSCLPWSLPTDLQLEPTWDTHAWVKQVHVMSLFTLPLPLLPFSLVPFPHAFHQVLPQSPSHVEPFSARVPSAVHCSIWPHCPERSLMHLLVQFLLRLSFLALLNLHHYLSFPLIYFSPTLGSAHTFVGLTRLP